MNYRHPPGELAMLEAVAARGRCLFGALGTNAVVGAI
jgi:hypothetical protein